ncbi:MAG: hypothetical protein H5T86_14210, partial [Armatimonadetes bacterium]|nr:hypothetical protein [Armatimonadota bacterium]
MTSADTWTCPSPFNVADRAQLFIDRLLVRKAENLCFTLHPATKHPANPLVKVDRPWEGWRLEIYGSVIYDEDEKLFKMWYLCDAPGYFECSVPTCYAVSQDGIHWEKPLVGTAKSPKFDNHNVVLGDAHLASVFKDAADPDPSRRYKMVCWDMTHGRYETRVSPDGIHWTKYGPERISPGGDVITALWDPYRQLYIAFPKIGTNVRGFNRRVFYVITSRDFLEWSEPRPAFFPDLQDDAGTLARLEEVRPLLDVPDDPRLMRTEFYGVGAYAHESCVIAFPWVFTINNNRRSGGNQEGPSEVQIAVSRDLVEWHRPFREPCILRGKVGEWDCGWFCTAASALRVGDEIWLYYQGSNYTHGTPCLYEAQDTGRLTKYTSSIGLAVWKLDRF